MAAITLGLSAAVVAGSAGLAVQSYLWPHLWRRLSRSSVIAVASVRGQLRLVSSSLGMGGTCDNIEATPAGWRIYFTNQSFLASANSEPNTMIVGGGHIDVPAAGVVGVACVSCGYPPFTPQPGIEFPGLKVQSLIVPYWILAVGGLALAVLPARYVATARCQRRRHREGRCIVCGYDLRGSPARCPECGAAAEHHRGKPES